VSRPAQSLTHCVALMLIILDRDGVINEYDGNDISQGW
jgi:histidinol phosphatase-like enzyme|tara:strand:- start:29384 stop:29497 length:114 start_codon:yes stop_codon:yes gene_type:complete